MASSGTEITSHDELRSVESDALFMSIGDGAIVANDRGEITRINQKACEILNLKDKDAIGQWYTDVVVAEHPNGERIPNIERPITEAFLTGKTVTGRLRYRRPGLESVIVNLTVSPIILKGQPIGAIEVFRDITKEVALEQAKDEFIALASHQLRTPASGVKQYIGMLMQGYAGKLSPEQKTMVKKAFDSNERQIAIINDLLQVARVDAGKIQLEIKRTDLHSMIIDVINEQTGKLAERQQLVEYSGKSDLKIDADEYYLRMALENLLDNASKYSPRETNIVISVRERDNHISISVSDEGVGIDPHDAENIFNKFYRLTSSISTEPGGTGLGLYWVKKIVELHGGVVRVNHRKPTGTRFTLKLPKQSPNTRHIPVKTLNGTKMRNAKAA